MALTELGRFERNEAHIIVGRLDAEGIDAVVFDGESNIYGNWLLVPVRVMVDEDDLDAARAVLGIQPS